MYTNKWKNGQKRNDFLARKCIYQYLIPAVVEHMEGVMENFNSR